EYGAPCTRQRLVEVAAGTRGVHHYDRLRIEGREELRQLLGGDVGAGQVDPRTTAVGAAVPDQQDHDAIVRIRAFGDLRERLTDVVTARDPVDPLRIPLR